MTYPTDRTTFMAWAREQVDENYIATATFAGNRKFEAILDNVIGEYSVISPLWSVGTITINGRYAILPDDWVEGPEWNTAILYALQRGINPEAIDLNQSGYEMRGNNESLRFGGSNDYGNGFGYGTGGASIQNPIVPSLPKQVMPVSSRAIIDDVSKIVFLLPLQNFITGNTFEVRYCALHKIQDADEESETPALMTIPKGDLCDLFDQVFERAIKGRIFNALNAKELAKQDYDPNKLKELAEGNPLTKKY